MEIFGNNKLYDHLEKVLHWKNKTSEKTLITAEIDMTNYCNNRCPNCAGFRDRQTSLTYNEAIDYIDQLIDMGLQGIVFTGGGEPLCNPDTLRVVEYVFNKGIDIGFVTNGLALDEKNSSELVKCCTWIRISLDASTKETYKLTHGMDENCFEQVLENIGILVKENKK